MVMIMAGFHLKNLLSRMEISILLLTFVLVILMVRSFCSKSVFHFSNAICFQTIDDWIDMAEESDSSSSSQDDIYVNLLENPERFTGYSGPAAIRVWRSVTEENCFGGADDQCLEKRVFYRLMSGLRASISTHVAREYLFSSKTDPYWGPNVPLFVKAVGAYPERLDNLYFTFLFLARAVSRAGDAILSMPLHTGNPEEDRIMREELKLLLNPPEILKREGWGNGGESSVGLWNLDAFLQLFDDGRKCHFPASTEGWKREVEESVDVCMHGFDESRLFQVSYFLPMLQENYICSPYFAIVDVFLRNSKPL